MSGEKVRVDKWLWSIRVFKSRSLATDVCKSGGVRAGEKVVKPSYLVGIGETLTVKKNGFQMVYKVKGLISKRVSATLAAECYENLTSEEELNKFNAWFIGKARPEIREKGLGRPTKRERREIDDFKIGQYEEDDFFEE